MALQGKAALNARLRAIKQTFKPIGKAWAEEDVRQNRARVPVRTGRLQRSFRVRNATQRKAVVERWSGLTGRERKWKALAIATMRSRSCPTSRRTAVSWSS